MSDTKVRLIIEAATDKAKRAVQGFADTSVKGFERAEQSARKFGQGLQNTWNKAKSAWVEIGAAVLLVGAPLGEWGVRTLNVHQTLGLEGTMLTKGPYSFTRNPQYVAEILIYVGVVLVTKSLMALIIGIIMMSWFFMAPFAEEPWLAKQFGKQYEEYRRKVPRFLGLLSFFSRRSGR